MADRCLVVAVGNTRTKVAVLSGLDLEAEPQIFRTDALTVDALREHLEALRDVPRAVLCSVVPTASGIAERAAREARCAALEPVDVRRVDWMQVDYDPPTALGADRLCCVLGARALHAWPVLVVDFGTATTVNAIDARGDFAGGFIAPGVDTSYAALHSATALLPRVETGAVMPPLLAHGTRDAIASGVLWSAWYAVRGVVNEAARALGAVPRVVLTGGAAGLFAALAPREWISDPHILLRGAAVFAAEGSAGHLKKK